MKTPAPRFTDTHLKCSRVEKLYASSVVVPRRLNYNNHVSTCL